MSNIHSFPINASAPSNVKVGTSSGTVLAANNDRMGLILTNISTGTMYLGLAGNAAVLNSGIVLGANGGSWTMDEFNFNNEIIKGIAHAANSILAIQQFVR